MITLCLTNGYIPKKGNSSSLENQRGIAKSCTFAKLTNKLLLARIGDIIEPQLLGVQSGLCAGRSTVEQTMVLRYILDMCCVSKRMTTIIFLDFSKAFDSIDRRAISIVLSKYGVSELLIANVMQFYIWKSAVVSTAHGNTENFQQHLVFLKVTHWHLSSSSPYLTTFFVKSFQTTLMVSLLLLVEAHVIPQFKLVLSCMQRTSQSLVTQLTRPKMLFDASK